MSEYELPLVFFTVFCQWAVGTIVAITVLILAQPIWLTEQKRFNALRNMAVVILAVNIIGSMLSLLHLGSPTGAYRAILGIGHSWLSREVVAFFLLNAVVFSWAAILFRFNHSYALIRGVSLLASVAGLAAILVSAQVYYQMSSHPLWHSPITHLSFITTALLLGFATLGLRISVFNAALDDHQRQLPTQLPGGILLAVALMLAVILGYSAGFSEQGKMLASAIAIFGSGLMSWLIFAGLIIATGLATYLYRQPVLSAGTASVLMLALLCASVSGRMLFYSGVMRQYPWF
ncbi:DMSO reductase anchor subunit [Serratia quinivorans]|jgi:DMSO reductase anchor subunit|uniref:dimethyl sulfoxide reductase anchor subunit family protein n=1 Tax=Serratia quinivorans TaxID=137545 RepID=UPI0021775E9B|nr:DmsC/YnfH family molybdoenzyme membrane anchor subunit [Serratia quinivorans]CAI1219532.1 DMSO reductase anchor subunit [Serratia quinivorans]CAI1528394.1 DMSO reductase anchor subunit [Serratia quinivorans]CAI1627950.1 DMSO reductase anchor subunit [Serratia quinivorans]CAI2075711.1 DMSO reductase anchor subunit [Serratia quinivorans]CAI2094419.1 DMSO reductase anchor subunit [Serratia quinivorans]